MRKKFTVLGLIFFIGRGSDDIPVTVKTSYSWDFKACDYYDEARDDYMVNPGWYERIYNWDDYGAVWIADTVTHWMPLPSPPKTGGTHE